MEVPTATIIIITTTIIWSLSTSPTETAPLSFNYTNFAKCSTDSITLFGNAACVDSVLQITGFDYYATGQAHYSKPLHLWDPYTGHVTNFTTAFTFAMDNDNGTWTCDGLAFFLASVNYTAPPVNATSGLLGLVDSAHKFNSTRNPFVAVEFDTYNNPDWDTWDDISHVGIDVNSVQSIASKRWRSNANGTVMSAEVSYKGRNLCVEFTGMTAGLTDVPRDTLCYEVDLKDYLTEWTVFGFSASTAWRYQSHVVKTWSFDSDLDSEGGPVLVRSGVDRTGTKSSSQPGSGKKSDEKKKTNAGLLVGLALGVVGGVAVLVFVGAMVVRVRKKRGAKSEQELPSGRQSPEVLLRAQAERRQEHRVMPR